MKIGRAASAVSDWFADNMRSKRRISVPFVPENKLMFASGFEFRSEWKETFVREQTYEGVFSGTMVTDECTYMNKVAAAVPYLQTEEATASLIGLANGGSLVLILPQEGTGLDGILSDGTLLQNIVSGTLRASKTSVEFSVPKVSFEETIDISVFSARWASSACLTRRKPTSLRSLQIKTSLRGRLRKTFRWI